MFTQSLFSPLDLSHYLSSLLARPRASVLPRLLVFRFKSPQYIKASGVRCDLLRLCHADDRDLILYNPGRIQVSCGQGDCLSEWEVICGSLEELS